MGLEMSAREEGRYIERRVKGRQDFFGFGFLFQCLRWSQWQLSVLAFSNSPIVAAMSLNSEENNFPQLPRLLLLISILHADCEGCGGYCAQSRFQRRSRIRAGLKF